MKTLTRVITDFEKWIASDDVIKTGANSYKEQTTQYKKTFTYLELLQYFTTQIR